eukprot:TRINITY_DN3_c0_g1_i14.p1 TRINITY_DN3_c0_g1~~TRINITY_DN3_c0_g1_i14.p1  ORF type:complete len:231 (-),score=14.21 TRINITY_DN3_c0_g1_i14:3983-4675(-)
MHIKLLNLNYNTIINNIELKKDNFFVLKYKKFDKIKINKFFRKTKKKLAFNKFISDYFFIFKKFESMTGCIPDFKNIDVRTKGKKKKRTFKGFMTISSPLFIFSDSFFDFYLLNHMYLSVNVFKSLDKRYAYLKQFFRKKFDVKLYLNSNSVSFTRKLFIKFILIKKLKKTLKKYYTRFKRRKSKRFYCKFYVISNYNFYFYKIFQNIMLNEHKLFLFMYKLFRNKTIKL